MRSYWHTVPGVDGNKDAKKTNREDKGQETHDNIAQARCKPADAETNERGNENRNQ